MKRLLLLFIFALPVSLHAEVVRESFEGVRQTGMGNASIALADDANALFTNPAGLATVKGVHFNLMNFTLGADSFDSVNRLGNAVFKGRFDRLIRTDTEYLRFSIMPTLIVPNFGFAIYQNASGYFDVKNLLTTGIDAYAFNDAGIATGFSIPVGPYFSFGATGKLFQRTGVDITMSGQDLITAAGSDINSVMGNLYEVLNRMAGSGYAVAVNIGALARVPLMSKGTQLNFAATADNVGDTTFKATGSSAPKSIKHSYNLGTALIYQMSKDMTWNNTVEVRHLLEPSTNFFRQFHFGSEFRHRIFAVRAGVYQKYVTGGFSLEFPPHTRLHFSTYGVETGIGGAARQHRWYLVQLNVGFNPF